MVVTQELEALQRAYYLLDWKPDTMALGSVFRDQESYDKPRTTLVRSGSV